MSNSPHNAIPCDSQPILAPKRRKSTKPPEIQTAVIAKALTGQSKSNIAKDLDITRGTVAAILNQTDIEHQVQLGRSRAISLIPRSLDVVENRLDRNDGSVAISLLRGTQVLQNQAVQVNVQNNGAMAWIQLNQAKAEQVLECPPIDTQAKSDKP